MLYQYRSLWMALWHISVHYWLIGLFLQWDTETPVLLRNTLRTFGRERSRNGGVECLMAVSWMSQWGQVGQEVMGSFTLGKAASLELLLEACIQAFGECLLEKEYYCLIWSIFFGRILINGCGVLVVWGVKGAADSHVRRFVRSVHLFTLCYWSLAFIVIRCWYWSLQTLCSLSKHIHFQSLIKYLKEIKMSLNFEDKYFSLFIQ